MMVSIPSDSLRKLKEATELSDAAMIEQVIEKFERARSIWPAG
jgi:hypothetical protein